MATGFSFKVQGLDKLIKVFHDLPEDAKKELKAELSITANEIRDGAKRDAPTDEGRIRQSISNKTTGELEFEVVAQSFYAGYLEFGTKTKTVIPPGLEDIAGQLKGPVGGNGDPLKAIEAWVKRKGIAGTLSVKTKKLSRSKKSLANIKSVAFLIWRKIRKEGIKPQPYFFKQMAPAEERLRRRLATIIKDLIS